MTYRLVLVPSAVRLARRLAIQVRWRILQAMVLSVVTSMLVMAGCASDSDGAAQVVQKMYEAINKGDTNAYLDTLAPSTRDRPDIGGILWQLTGGSSVGAGVGPVSAGIDLGGLLSPTTHEMEYTGSVQSDGHVVVEARGKVRIMMGEYDFCESFDVVKEGGNWYIDRFHPARLERIQRYTDRNLQLAAQAGTTSGSSDPFADLGQLLSAYGEGMELALNLCD